MLESRAFLHEGGTATETACARSSKQAKKTTACMRRDESQEKKYTLGCVLLFFGGGSSFGGGCEKWKDWLTKRDRFCGGGDVWS